MPAPAYDVERKIAVGLCGVSSGVVGASTGTEPHARPVVLMDEFKREVLPAVAEVVHATATGRVPAECVVQYKNLAAGHGLTNLAAVYAAACNPRHGIAYSAAQRLVRAQMAFLDAHHPQASALVDRWCPVVEERSVEWEATATDQQDAAERALARHPSSVGVVTAALEVTVQQRIATQYRERALMARLALLRGGR